MRFDDLISVLKFLTRQQLVKICFVNRQILAIVEEHFAEWPAFYCKFTIGLQKDSYFGIKTYNHRNKNYDNDNADTVFSMHLKAMNCNCEQQFSINIKNLWTYKLTFKCKCELEQSLRERNEHEKEYFELKEHKKCKDWLLLADYISEIPLSRQDSSSVNYILSILKTLTSNRYLRSPHPSKCCAIWAHKVHDNDKCSQDSIAKNYIFAHRHPRTLERNFSCSTTLHLKSTNIETFINHLNLKFVKIYKLYIKYACFYGVPNIEEQCNRRNIDDDDGDENTKCLEMLRWLLVNNKIQNVTKCHVDVGVLERLLEHLKSNNKNVEQQQQILLDSIGGCGHLKFITNGTKWENLSMIQQIEKMLLPKPLMLSLHWAISFRDLMTIENILQSYNPQCDHRRLVVFEQRENNNNNMLNYLIKSFLNSNCSNTYFLLVYDHFERGKFKHKYYNGITNEYLHVSPATRYSVTGTHPADDRVPVYLARHSKLANIADEEFNSFFGRVEQIVETNEKYNYQNEKEEDAQWIFSFSSYLAKVFPGFTLNGMKSNYADNQQELYNGEQSQEFRSFPLTTLTN